MTDSQLITGKAAPLDIANLDTDQIMPKQFLRGIDKKGLDKGVLWDLRFDGEGQIWCCPRFAMSLEELKVIVIFLLSNTFKESNQWTQPQLQVKVR